MKKKTNINEDEKFELSVTKDDLKNSSTTKKLADLQKNNPNIEVTLSKDKENGMSMSDLLETDAVIEPQDQATIKYLSNVIDANTGKVSQPFTIGANNYQMVRALKPDGEIFMGVMCLEDSNIYEVAEFEKNVALPMKEMLEKGNKEEVDEIREMGLSEFKHYVVNEKANTFKKFKTIQELVKHGLKEDEKYMGLREFKKFYETKIFGRKRIEETQPERPDVTKAFDQINKKVAPVMNKVDQPAEKIQFITKMVNALKMDKTLITKLINALKNQGETPFDGQQQGGQQQGVMNESVKRNTIKVIKKKEL